MPNEALNQSLIELQQSLSKIDSARNQVSSVADESEKLIMAFREILKKLQSIDENIGLDKGEFRERLDNSIKRLNQKFDKVNENISLKTKKLNNQLDDITALFSQKVHSLKGDFKEKLDESFNTFNLVLSEGNTSILSKSNKLNEEFQSTFTDFSEQVEFFKDDFREKLEKCFAELNQDLTGVSTTISSKSKELNEDLDNITNVFSQKVEKLNTGIEKFNSELESTEKRISELDLKMELIENFIKYHTESRNLIKERIDEIESRINKKLLRNLIITILGMLMLGLIIFFK